MTLTPEQLAAIKARADGASVQVEQDVRALAAEVARLQRVERAYQVLRSDVASFLAALEGIELPISARNRRFRLRAALNPLVLDA